MVIFETHYVSDTLAVIIKLFHRVPTDGTKCRFLTSGIHLNYNKASVEGWWQVVQQPQNTAKEWFIDQGGW